MSYDNRKHPYSINALLFIVSFFPANGIHSLDEILLESMIPSSSHKCISHKKTSMHNQTSQYSFEYEPSSISSKWDNKANPYEKDVFLAEMTNIHENENKSWTIRIGQGGNMYSFQGVYGEALPPQNHPQGYFVDEVMQSVSTNVNKNREAGSSYFIHQAGDYMTDGNYTHNHPFYSPSLAKYCQENECSFASWGQQAHIPIKFKSDVLYFNRYRDCGDGVMEVTSVIHNAATDLHHGDDVSNLDVPWGGIRESTLRDVFLSKPDGTMKRVYPPEIFGKDYGINLLQTGGYTAFAEQVIVSRDLYDQHPYRLPHGVTLILKGNPAATYAKTQSQTYHQYCLHAELETTENADTHGCKDCELWLINKRTGEKIYVRLVIHWAIQWKDLYFCPENNVNATLFNAMFQKGDEILVSRVNSGKSVEDNRALTFVHGFQPKIEQRNGPSRIRWGSSGSIARDYTVYSINTHVKINPGDTYIYQQFMITGRLAEMETTVSPWVNEVYEELIPLGEFPEKATEIALYSNNPKSFGVHVMNDHEKEETCSKGVRRCIGSSAPGLGLGALFVISCGNQTYVGSNKYHFSPPMDAKGHIRSYACTNEPLDVRPKWKLLGFFEDGTCDYLKEASFDEDFCAQSVSRIS